MALVVPNVGELELLNRLLQGGNYANDGNYVLKLFKNNYTPTTVSTLGDFTEADFTNYVSVTLSQTMWGTASTNGNDKAESSYSQQSWTCGSTGNTVYGYYVEGAVSGQLLWAEKFGSAKVLTNGDILNLVPVITLSTE